MKNILLFVFAISLSSFNASAEKISGEVKIDKKLMKKISQHKKGALFVFARAADKKGRGFPLAVKRFVGTDKKPLKFPLKFSLSQKDSMVSGTKFEGAIKIIARFSPTGDVMAKAGAFEGVVGEDKSIVVGKKATATVTINKAL